MFFSLAFIKIIFILFCLIYFLVLHVFWSFYFIFSSSFFSLTTHFYFFWPFILSFCSFIISKKKIPKKQATLVGQGKLQPKAPENSFDLFRQLVEYCCQFEATERPSFQQICGKMQQYYDDENLEKLEMSQKDPNNSQQSPQINNNNDLQEYQVTPQQTQFQTNSKDYLTKAV